MKYCVIVKNPLLVDHIIQRLGAENVKVYLDNVVFVKYNGTIKELSKSISENMNYPEIFICSSEYFGGFAPTEIWEWLI